MHPCAPSRRPMRLTHVEFADELEELAGLVVRLPGVSRRNPHAFAEAKSELAGRIRSRASELRAGIAARQNAATIIPGPRVIDRRRVLVEVRRSR